MSFPTYAEFTRAPRPDLGLVPIGWDARRLKFCVSYNDDSLPETTDPDLEIAYIDISSVDLINGITAVETMTFEKAPSRARRIVRDGDTIISTVRTYLKAISPIKDPLENMIVSTGFAVIRPMDGMDRKYLGYALQGTGFIDQVVANSTGVSYPAINPSTLVCIPVCFPVKRDEQKRIGDFLDWKVGQIDALIAKKRELVETLKEKRLTVITQAVTKGLDPSIPQRDSNIEWLGQVPRHWVMKKVRHCSDLITSGSRGWAQYFSDSGELFLRITNLDRGSINLLLDDIQRVDPPAGAEGARTHTKAGDLLISITADLGSVAVIPFDLEPAYVSQHLALVRLDSHDIDPEWIAYSVFSHIGKYQLKMAGYGGTKVQLSLPDIKEIAFCHPPTLEEQKRILEHIRSNVEYMDALIEVASRAIARLTEYRTALITAATTGKIDVRGIKLVSEV